MRRALRNAEPRSGRLTIVLVTTALFVMLGTIPASMQTRTPYDKDRLLKVVKLNALSTQEVVKAVQDRGVDFQLTPSVEAEFKDAGARPELLGALRTNYRAPAPPPRPPASTGSAPPTNPGRKPLNVPPGPPLSKNEIITLLQSGATPDRVEQFVEVRGVNFQMTPEIAREINSAGGNRSLVGAITERALSGSNASSAPAGPAPGNRVTPKGPDYDELTDQAIAAMQANNANHAIGLLQRAAQMDATRPTAYQLLGFAQLYGRKDLVSAENSMRAAVERGGSAAFYVYHDHDGVFNTFCEGSFFVNKSSVSFKAKDGNHTFDAPDSLIKEAEVNGFVGVAYGAFHLKLKDVAKDKGKTFNFAPATKQKTEANLIIRMIQSYQ